MYCLVEGCGKYSAKGKGFVILPKNLDRAKKWIEAAGLEKTSEELSYLLSSPQRLKMKFCKRHFLPTSFLNQTMAVDAVPRLYLPDTQQTSNHGVLCNKCKTIISGIRYKCVTCEDFDLCTDCEKKGEHQEHNMLRISKPISTIAATNLASQMRHQSPGSTKTKSTTHLSIEPTNVLSVEPDNKEISSDDEPITKYISSYEHELPEDVKTKICNEVDRVLSVINLSFVAKRRTDNRHNNPAKSSKPLNISTQMKEHNFYPEVEFADVNDADFQGDVKNEDVLDMAPESVPELIASGKLFS